MSTETEEQPRRIAIIGGGISSLVTALELTATEELRRKHEITLYQMGWRLGGKLASGANPHAHDRNEEHGLHVWFGFYDNAFFEIDQCYKELLTIQPQFRYQSYLDAFKPNDFTPIGHRSQGPGGYAFWDMHWPTRPGTPGVYEPHAEPLAILREILGWLRDQVHNEIGLEKFVSAGLEKIMGRWATPLERLLSSVTGAVKRGLMPPGGVFDAFEHAIHWLEAMEVSAAHEIEVEAERLSGFLTDLKKHLIAELERMLIRDPDDHPILSAVELVFTNIVGLLNPKYGWLQDFNLNRLDYLDYRAWLLENGGDPDVVARSSYIRALYDIPFAYEDGDITKPNFATGAAMRWCIRSAFTYRGHAMYVPQAGFGEAVIAPYYEVLKNRGVKFKFFHLLKSTALSDDGNSIHSLHFSIQAEVLTAGGYESVKFTDGLYHWPIHPYWDQLKNGEILAGEGADFESHWNTTPSAGTLDLTYGTDFDHIVIGLAGAVWKRLNAEDTPPLAALLDASPAFRGMSESLGIVATAGVQFWFNKPVTDLGWKERPATVGGPEPLDVWADMSQVLATEGWRGVTSPPQSLHYLCGPIATTLFNQPASKSEVPGKAHDQVIDLTTKWLEQHGVADWPGANDGSGGFNWNELYDDSGAVGKDRLASQFMRANISPTECCGTSFAGTTRFRVSADRMLFTNASIVGADTDTGINVTCVEGATISGRKASRAICGSPRFIPGEHFMGGGFPPPPKPLPPTES